MEKDTPIVITPVSNGFIVTPNPDRLTAVKESESGVFQSFEELGLFLAAHFSHRAKGLQSDD